MYISITNLQSAPESDLLHKSGAVHLSQRDAKGFRWSMLLRDADDPASFVAASMWLTPDAAQDWRNVASAAEPTHGYDVTTARGSMTPAAAVALVEWQPGADQVERFTTRWNAVYHAIEDAIGSRLARDLAAPDSFAAVHVVTDPARLDPKALAATLTDSDGLSISPAAVRRFEVVLITEAP